MPAYPWPIDRLMTTMLLALSTSRIGIPEIALPGLRAAGLVTSLAPMTSATSAWGNCGLISSMSLSNGYGRGQVEEPGSERFDLGPAFGTYVVRRHDGAEAPRRTDRLEARNARAEYEQVGRP